MSRKEADREDLLREATALVERMEIRLAGAADSWVIGFRRNGAASIFVGADPVFQFNTGDALRRAYSAGRLVKAEGGALFWLERQRENEATLLVRTPLSKEECHGLLTNARLVLGQLEQAVNHDAFDLIGAVPSRAVVLEHVREWLAEFPEDILIASSPGVS